MRLFVIIAIACGSFTGAKHGQEWIRTTEGVSQQIYSLPRLATSVPTQIAFGPFF